MQFKLYYKNFRTPISRKYFDIPKYIIYICNQFNMNGDIFLRDILNKYYLDYIY